MQSTSRLDEVGLFLGLSCEQTFLTSADDVPQKTASIYFDLDAVF